MRTIAIDEFSSVEIWGGRRLYLLGPEGPQLFALPKGAMIESGNKTSRFLAFGSINATSVLINGSTSKGRVSALAKAIIQFEGGNKLAMRIKIQ